MEKTMEKIVALAKARGFVYPGSEIYGGLANTWDYGNLGVELKNNVKKAWWQKFVQESPYNVGVDCAILMNPQTWVASGHLGGFSDPLMDCKDCHERFRADKLIEDWADENNYEIEGSVDAWSQEQMKNFIDEKNICEVIKFQEEWCQNRECYSIPVLNNENIGIMHILHNFDKLDLIGAMIKIDEKVIAYSLGEVLNDEYAVIHIEKGLNNYIGSYQMINYLFAQNEFSKCKYINREDDFGDEGLREAKESYHPVFLLKKYEIVGIK